MGYKGYVIYGIYRIYTAYTGTRYTGTYMIHWKRACLHTIYRIYGRNVIGLCLEYVDYKWYKQDVHVLQTYKLRHT